jgi:nucleoside-diphosphate-sugar epimerase
MSNPRPRRDVRVLVTGANGFIGRHCLPLLGRKYAEVHAVTSRPTIACKESANWHQADLLDRSAIESLIALIQPSHLLHLAWLTSPGQYRTSPDNARWTEASLELVRQFAAYGGRRLVIAGTCFEYGPAESGCRESSTPLLPSTPYGQAKLSLWQAVETLARQQGLSAAWSRTFHVYGPHEHPQRFVASLIRALVEGRPALCSSGEQFRDFLYVADVAAAHVGLLDSEVQGAVNVASGQAVRIKEVAQAIGQLLQRPELIQLGALPTSASEPAVLAADVTRLRREVGWSPEYVLRRGLQHTIDWWRNYEKPLCSHALPARFATPGQRLNS